MRKYRITYYRGTPQEATFDLNAYDAMDALLQAGVELGFMFKNKKVLPTVDKIEAVDEVAEKLALSLAEVSVNGLFQGKHPDEMEKKEKAKA